MSAPEVRDITFDRPDYTAGAFIVFTGQTSEVAPPAEFWAKKAFAAAIVGDVEAVPGTARTVINLTASPGYTFFGTDLVVMLYGKIGLFASRYNTTAPPSYPRTSLCAATAEVKLNLVTIDMVRVDSQQPYFHKPFKTPLTLFPGDNLRVEAISELGTAPVKVAVLGYWTFG